MAGIFLRKLLQMSNYGIMKRVEILERLMSGQFNMSVKAAFMLLSN